MQNLVSIVSPVKHKEALDYLPVPVFVFDNQGVIYYRNFEADNVTDPELTGIDNVFELSSSFKYPDFQQAITQYQTDDQAFETLIIINKPEQAVYKLKMVAYHNDNGFYLITLCPVTIRTSDSMRLKNNVKDLKQFSRFNVMREVSAAIAEQLNQPLTAILSYTQAMQRLYLTHASGKEITDAMERVVINATKAGHLIRDIRFRAQLKTNTLSYTTISLNQLIQECIDLTDLNYFNNSIILKTELESGGSKVCVDTTQLKQVIISVLNNAIDAVLEQNVKKPEINITSSVNELYFTISIADNGLGIADSIRQKLFEPFISTRKDGIGTGLSMSQHIINLHKGNIKVLSNNDPQKEQTGTLVIIQIPC